MGLDSSVPVTALLQSWRAGDADALARLVPIVFDELRRLAGAYLRQERPGHTLQPTELVSEAYLRLFGGAPLDVADRSHFFAIAARAMRQILVDHARHRVAQKRGGGARPVTFDEAIAGPEHPEQLLSLHAALEALVEVDERKARIVELHYFGGLTTEQVAEAVDLHVNTVRKDLRLAEAWIRRRLREPD